MMLSCMHTRSYVRESVGVTSNVSKEVLSIIAHIVSAVVCRCGAYLSVHILCDSQNIVN